MLRKIAGCFLVLGALFSPTALWALGLGDIQLDSGLNQPLRAEIMLISATQEEVADLEVKLASAEAFESYGLDRPSYLFDLKFNLERNGAAYAIKVSSVQPIKEPFVTLLVEAVWARGRLLREYTVFLDPPVFVERTQAPAPVATPNTGSRSSNRTGNIRRTQSAPRADTSSAAATPSTGGGDTYRVRRGDALWAIADRFRPTDATVNQMMIAIYRGNPSAFDGNINNLKAGVTLAIPDRADALYLGDQEANTQVRAQNNDWRQARGQAPTAASAAKAVLELVPPEGVTVSSGDGEQADDSAQVQSLEAKIAELEAQLAAERAENERLINLQSNELAGVQDQMGEEGVGTVETTPEETTPEETVGEEITEPVAEEPVETTDPEVADPAVVPPVVQTPEPSLITKAIDFVKGIWLWLLIGLVGIGLAAVFMLRRGGDTDDDWQSGEWEEQSSVAPGEEYEPTESQPPPDFDSDDAFVVVEGENASETGDATEEFAVDERLFEDTGTFTPGELEIERAEQAKADVGATAEYPFEDTMIGHDALQLDESDPLAEADFHMAYGLYDQAADLVSSAAEKAPERLDLKVKLLEIFFVWGNKDKFLEGAKSLQQSLGADTGGEWDKIVIMGKQLCPEESLFSGEFSGGGDVDLALDDGGMGELDLLTGEDGGTDIVELDLDEALSSAPLVGGDVPPDSHTSESSVEELRDDLDSLKRETTMSLGDAALDLDLGLGGEIEQIPDTDMVQKPIEDLGESDVVDIDFELKTEDTKETAVLEEQGSAADETVLSDLEGLDDLRDAFDGGDTARLGDIELGLDDDATVQTPQIDLEPTVDSTSNTVETLTLHSGPNEGDLGLDDDHSDTAVLGREESTVESPTLTMAGDDTIDAAMPDFDVFSDETRELSSPDFDMAASDTVTTKASISDFDIFADGDDTVEAGVDFSLDGEATTEAEMPMDLGDPTQQMPVANDDIDEVGTKLDLARAFMDMGDSDGARSILEEVLDEGNTNQQQEAKTLLDTLS